MTDQTTTEPVAAAPCNPATAPCCKCAAYREIIADQAAKLAEAVALAKGCSESLDYVQVRLRKVAGAKS